MKNTVFLIVGLVLISVGILVYFVGGSAKIVGPHGGPATVDPASTRLVIQYAVGGGFGLLGALFTFFGLKGRAQEAKTAKLNSLIMQTGIETTGTIAFVDKNYYVTVNNKPIYSIVEYTFKDESGRDYIRRVNNIPSDWVIRNKIEVGGSLKVKYLRENPEQNVMVVSG